MTDSHEQTNEPQQRRKSILPTQRISTEFRRIKRTTLPYSNNSSTNQNIILQLLESTPELKSIIEILHKKVKERTSSENKKLISFLLSKDIQSQLTEYSNEIYLDADTFYNYLVQYVSIRLLKQDDPIYLKGDKADFIHYILYGNISTFSFEKSSDVLTADEYYKYLDELIGNNPKDSILIMNIIETNNDIYPLYSLGDIVNYKDILRECKYRFYKEERAQIKLDELVKDNNNCSQDESINISKTISIKNETEFEKENFYYTKLKSYFRNGGGKQLITKLAYKKESSFDKGEYFGSENVIDNIHTLISKCISDYAVIISINKKSFITHMQNDYNNHLERERDHLHLSFFFKKMHRDKFIKKVFNICNEIELSKHQTLLKQQDNIDKFYFSRYGTFQIYLEKTSLNDLKHIIKVLKSFLPKKQQLSISVSENYHMNHSYNTIEKSMEIKRKFLIKNTELSLFGEYEFLYPQLNACSLFSVNVISDKAKLYTLDYDKYLQLLNKFSFINNELQEATEYKLKTLLERLISICNNYHKKINEEYNLKLEEETIMSKKLPYQQYNTHNNNDNKVSKSLKTINNNNDNMPTFILKKNRANYISHDNDLFNDLVNKHYQKEIIIQNRNTLNTLNKDYSFASTIDKQPNASTIQHDNDNDRHTLSKKEIKRYNSPTVCLPIIDNVKLRYDYMKKAIKNNIFHSSFKSSRYSPIKLQHVPLINHLRKKQNESKIDITSKDTKETEKKVDLTLVSPTYKETNKPKNVIYSYMAIHQYIDLKKKKINNSKVNNI